MSVSFTARYLGNKKLEIIHGPSGTAITTAAPVDNQGDGSSFSPTDLCSVSLGACMLTTIAIFAERSGIDLTGMRMSSEKHMSSEAPRRIARILLQIHLPAALSGDERTKLERVAHTCPVSKSLSTEMQIELEFFYDI